jgi:predicted ATP-dependent endonuclease of OLD family
LKIKELQISNILSFKFHENILDSAKVIFEDNLNIFIGENGAGKSTALEVINFIFKRVLFTQFNVNQDLYSRRTTINPPDRKNILSPANNSNFSGFRLEPNWNTENKPQIIRLVIILDDIDVANIDNLISNKEKLFTLASLYTNHTSQLDKVVKSEYTLEITLNKAAGNFTTTISPTNDAGYAYLVNYNYYKYLIDFHNLENPLDQIPPLFESFMLIGGYRNYYAFNPSVSIQGSSAAQQIQEIRVQEFSKSLNSIEQSEPSIFNLVRLRIAGKHFELFGESSNREDSEKTANNQAFLININKRLKLVNLEVKIEFTDKQRWAYSFHFYDLKREKPLSDINSLSAGQKAIIHLVFEAYGRGDLKGGLVIIDEPEIHLHCNPSVKYIFTSVISWNSFVVKL